MTKKVLIVDDSLVSRMMIKEIIHSEHPKWDCSQAASADKAIDACKEAKFDFITLDLNIPGMSSLDAAPTLIESQADAKISLLTANIQSSVKMRADQLGIGFISKPIEQDGILGFCG